MKIWIKHRFINQGETPLKYLQLYWYEYIQDLLDINNSAVRLEGPRMLIHEILSEITYNALRNSDNISYFRAKLGGWLKKDSVFKRMFGSDVNLSFKYLEPKNKLLLQELFGNILRDFSTKRYFEQLFEDFVVFMEKKRDLTYENKMQINLYAELLIAEFQSEGFALEDIKGVLTDIDGVVIAEGGTVIAAAESFYELNRADYESKEVYYEAIKERIANRTIAECLEGVIKKFYHNPIKGFMLIRLTGLKGNIDTTIDGVHIYSPRNYKYLTDFCISDIEKIDEKINFLNAAIPIQSIGLNSSIAYAKSKLVSVIEILSLIYETDVKIDYGRGNFVIVVDGKESGSTHCMTTDDERYIDKVKFYNYVSSMDASEIEEDKDYIIKHYKAAHYPLSETSTRLTNAVHWCYKAQTAATDEEKLLHSWFAMEGMMKVSQEVMHSLPLKKEDGVMKVIQYIASAILSITYFHNHWCEVYSKLLYTVNQSCNCFELSDDLLQRAYLNLKKGDKYNIKAFLACIPELEDAVSHHLLKNELHEVGLFYCSKEGFEAYLKQVQADILVVYRLRNLIAHNAVIPAESLKLYSRKAYVMCRSLVKYFIAYREKGEITMGKMIINTSLKYLRFDESFNEELKKMTGK